MKYMFIAALLVVSTVYAVPVGMFDCFGLGCSGQRDGADFSNSPDWYQRSRVHSTKFSHHDYRGPSTSASPGGLYDTHSPAAEHSDPIDDWYQRSMSPRQPTDLARGESGASFDIAKMYTTSPFAASTARNVRAHVLPKVYVAEGQVGVITVTRSMDMPGTISVKAMLCDEKLFPAGQKEGSVTVIYALKSKDKEILWKSKGNLLKCDGGTIIVSNIPVDDDQHLKEHQIYVFYYNGAKSPVDYAIM